MYYVYILRLSDGSLYIGYSTDLKQRVKKHQWGLVSSTKNFRPVKLIFYCAFEQRNKTVEFEKYLKTGAGFAFRNKRLI